MEEIIILNGKIYTMDKERPLAHNVYILNGKIEAVDTEREAELAAGGARVIDLGGKAMFPGFHDSHLHMLLYGVNKMDGVDLSEARSVEEMKQMLSDYIKASGKKPGSWIIGYGWNHERFPDKKMPTAKDLDEVSTEYYIVIKRVCIHIAAVNSKLLGLCGISKDTYLDTGHIGRLGDGQPDGLIYEDAISNAVMCQKPPYELEEIENIILKCTESLKSCGFTAVQSDDMKTFSDFESKINILKAFDRLRNQGRLPIRVMEQLQVTSLEELKQLLKAASSIKNDDMFAVQMVKLILDGSLGGWTAAVSHPYKDNQAMTGILNFTDEELEEIAGFCYEEDLQMAFHCIGDRAVAQAIELVEKMKARYGKELRPRIVHCQLPKKGQPERMAEMGILADIQPMFVPSDYKLAGERLEESQQEVIYAWKTLLECGVSLSGSSDSPVERYEPFYGIRAAVCRADLNNEPKGGWKPQQKLTVEEAISLYTSGSAYSVNKEEKMGKIKKGFYADLMVTDKDPYTIEETKLHEIKAEMVICAGR